MIDNGVQRFWIQKFKKKRYEMSGYEASSGCKICMLTMF